ncbi:hypothetical protein ZHAS_00019572 [Anopheles sinensis]|uniref:Uncharacterized protein n=1 Tax=Anopheles sinensis TaxID=74873 RepID=A0A084WMR8_ANOSI|nr:hypothetical protein ZHAS_00019572 [Anopheles sinensis]
MLSRMTVRHPRYRARIKGPPAYTSAEQNTTSPGHPGLLTLQLMPKELLWNAFV